MSQFSTPQATGKPSKPYPEFPLFPRRVTAANGGNASNSLTESPLVNHLDYHVPSQMHFMPMPSPIGVLRTLLTILLPS
jgi:hypothetical protein